MVYLHGGNATPMFEKFGLSQRPVIDFSVSVSPLGPPSIVVQRWPELVDCIQKYPSAEGGGIKRYYSQAYSIPEDAILPGNGSVELMYRCFSVLSLNRVAVVCPSFFDYQNALHTAGIRCDFLHLMPETDFAAPSFETLCKCLERNDGIVIGNPNNPTGTIYETSMLLALADRFPSKYIFVDEAFLPFLNNERECTLLSSDLLRNNLIVFCSLTKIFAIPGLRAGCVVSSSGTIEMLAELSPPWMTNTIVDKIAPMLLHSDDYIANVRTFVQDEMQAFKTAFRSLKGISQYCGPVNFSLVGVARNIGIDSLLTHLLQNGILVRDCRNFAGLKGDYFRFCVKTHAENVKLVSALRRFCALPGVS